MWQFAHQSNFSLTEQENCRRFRFFALTIQNILDYNLMMSIDMNLWIYIQNYKLWYLYCHRILHNRTYLIRHQWFLVIKFVLPMFCNNQMDCSFERRKLVLESSSSLYPNFCHIRFLELLKQPKFPWIFDYPNFLK